MSILFEAITIKNMEIPNRFVRSATYDGLAEPDGAVSDRQMKLFTDLADGGVGLIVTGIAHVHPSGQARACQISLATDHAVKSLKTMTDAVHERDAKLAVQLFHGGREATAFLKGKKETGIAPSVILDDPYFQGDYREITEAEIEEMIRAYGDAAQRACEAGFDAVQVHGAHAFLPSQFLSPFTNRRTDRWGGSLENRLRFHQEIYKEIRKKVGVDYPVLIKLGVEDGFAGGLEFSEGKLAAQALGQTGYDCLEISQGLRGEDFKSAEFKPDINTIEQEAYFRKWCREVTHLVAAPTMMMGGLRSFELMEEAVEKGETAMVSMSRPFIREPNLVNRWRSGDREKARCISCNQCLGIVRKGDGLQCAVEMGE